MPLRVVIDVEKNNNQTWTLRYRVEIRVPALLYRFKSLTCE